MYACMCYYNDFRELYTMDNFSMMKMNRDNKIISRLVIIFMIFKNCEYVCGFIAYFGGRRNHV